MKLAGAVVLITGAAGGIGATLCRVFAEKGSQVAALDRREEVLSLASSADGGTSAVALIGDVTDAPSVATAVRQVESDVGSVDVLINNAGYSDTPVLARMTPEKWDEHIAGNLNGAYYCTNAVLPGMVAKQNGVIVNIGSVNGFMPFGDPAYSAAKAGLVNLTRSVAMEYGRHGIRANAICPGSVRTPVWERRAEQNPEILAQLVKWYPLGRIVEPNDVANAAVFLASDEASAITGTELVVDCGLMAGNLVMSREITMEDEAPSSSFGTDAGS